MSFWHVPGWVSSNRDLSYENIKSTSALVILLGAQELRDWSFLQCQRKRKRVVLNPLSLQEPALL